MNRLDKVVWKNRNILAGLPLCYALVEIRWESEAEAIIWPLAIALCVLGVALRTWSSCHCAYGQHRPKTLTTSGPFAYVRNPLYIGNLLILAGGAVASELVWFVPVALAWAFLVYTRVVRYEEHILLRDYGDAYRRYCEQVLRWVPTRTGMTVAKVERVFFATAVRQLLNLLVLVPFLMKELNWLGLGHPW